jgi:hypothetical protein
MGLDNSTNNEKAMTTEDDSSAVVSRASTSNRRRFTRNAIAGSAVLLSLGNRPAWGQDPTLAGCMSVMTLNSFDPTLEHGWASQPPGGNKPGHDYDLALRIDAIADPPGWVSGPGNPQTCALGDDIALIKNGSCNNLASDACSQVSFDTERTSLQQSLF